MWNNISVLNSWATCNHFLVMSILYMYSGHDHAITKETVLFFSGFNKYRQLVKSIGFFKTDFFKPKIKINFATEDSCLLYSFLLNLWVLNNPGLKLNTLFCQNYDTDHAYVGENQD